MGKNESFDEKYNFLTAVCTGRVIPISELDDTIYSTGILGDGYAVFTSELDFFSPVNGVVEKISNNGHSFNIISDDGLKLLIHIGKDSECDSRLPTSPQIEPKAQVKQGQLICKLNCAPVRDHDECVVEVVANNSDSFEVFEVTPQNVLDIKVSVIKYK